jgi:hypothetical protein
MIGVALGINNLVEIFKEKYYENLEGGILESFGRLFRNAVKLYVYPMRKEAYDRYVAASDNAFTAPAAASGDLISADTMRVVPHLQHLYAHLMENHYIENLTGFNPASLDIISRDVLGKIQANEPSWEEMVPPVVAGKIKQLSLFGYRPAPSATAT